MRPQEYFRFCPHCGSPAAEQKEKDIFHCGQCQFHYYFNPTVASAAIIVRPDAKVLFIRRAKEPAKGKLAVPGGFIDIGEKAEEALRREIREEVGIEVGPLQFLCSHPNEYPYKNITYPVLDFLFVTSVDGAAKASALDDVESFYWLDPSTVDPEEIAFPSVREAVRLYVERRSATL